MRKRSTVLTITPMNMATVTLLLLAESGLLAQTGGFDVATMKLSSSPEPRDTVALNGRDTVAIDTRASGVFGNGKLTFTNARLNDLLKFAYGLSADSQLAGPDWIKSTSVRFDVIAQAPPDIPRRHLESMLQALLAERLKLAVHHERRESGFLALVPAGHGPNLHEAAVDAALDQPGLKLAGRIVSAGMSMDTLAMLLSRFQRDTVIDQTGLQGRYEIKLEWSPNQDPDAGPSLVAALQDQLGMKLESRRGPLDVLVVDRAEKTPADN